MTGTDKTLTDDELDILLNAATTPPLPPGFELSLSRRLAAESANNVVPFPQRAKPMPHKVWQWQMPAALAASLVLGIWLGSQGTVSSAIAGATETAMLGSASDFGPAGLDETDDYDLDGTT